MIRATTGGVMKTYRMNLMNSFISQNKAMNTILSQRVFNSYAEDPAAAAKAFRLRRSRMTVSAQYNVCTDTLKKYETGFQCLQSIDGMIDTRNGSDQMNTLKETTLKMLNDPYGDARTELAKALDQLSETIIQSMNQKYGDNFIFAGADGQNVPFEIKNNQLFYRGVPVDASEPELYNGGQVKLNAAGEVDPNGTNFLLASGVKTISKADHEAAVNNNAIDPSAPAAPDVLTDADDPGSPYEFTDADGNGYYIIKDSAQTMSEADYNTAVTDAEKLKFLTGEQLFVDIGLGFQENENGQLIASSAFDAALNGLTFLGYGLDEDGDPKNIYSLVQEMKKIADDVPQGELWDTPTYERFHDLVQKLEKASSEFHVEFTNMAASTTKLENNEKLLKENFYNLKEQYSELEDVDMVEAINSFLWAQYSYNAALRVGNSVLSQSLMDYIN